MFNTVRFILLQVMFVFMLSACATLPSDFEEPAVSVMSFKPKTSTGITPQFEIVLHITNPNREPLTLEGMSYTIHIEKNKVMSGVANDLPTIEPYGEAEVTLNATVNLMGGLKLLTGLTESKTGDIAYQFKAKLDVGTFMPRINVVREGVF